MSKRILSLVLSVVMVASVLVVAPVSAVTYRQTDISVIPDKTTAQPGDTINYTITLGPVSDMGSLQMKLVIPEGLTYKAGTGKIADGLAENMGFDMLAWTESTKVINGCASAADYASDAPTLIATFQCTANEGFSGTAEVGLTYLEFCSCITFEDHTANFGIVTTAVTVAAENPEPVLEATPAESTDPASETTPAESTEPASETTPAESTEPILEIKPAEKIEPDFKVTINEEKASILEVPSVKDNTPTYPTGNTAVISGISTSLDEEGLVVYTINYQNSNNVSSGESFFIDISGKVVGKTSDSPVVPVKGGLLLDYSGEILTFDFSSITSHIKKISVLSDNVLKYANVIGDDDRVTTADAMCINSHAKGINKLW